MTRRTNLVIFMLYDSLGQKEVAVAKDADGVIVCHRRIDALTNAIITDCTRIGSNKMVHITT